MIRRLIPLLCLGTVLLAGCAPTTSGDSSGSPGSASPPSATPTGADTIATTGPDTAGPIDSRIPAEAMLTGEDVGPGYTAEDWLQSEDHGSINMMFAYCGVYDYTEAGDHEVTSRRGSVGRNQEEYLLVTVTRYEPGWAQRYIDDVTAVLPECASIPVGGNPADIAEWTVLDVAGAGAGSVLIHEERPTVIQFHALVRRGDVVAELRIHTGGDEDHARAIVQAAADRLCAADLC
jgi:hypothetical protein